MWVADLESGHSEPLVPGFKPLDYGVSGDGKQIVMEAEDSEGKARLWVASFERKAVVRQIPNVEGRQAMFGPTGEIFFRHIEGASGFVYRVRPDGSGLRKALKQPAFALTGISPDGKWLEVWSSVPGKQPSAVQLLPVDGGDPVIIGSNAWLKVASRGKLCLDFRRCDCRW